jgi:hypothetical protein
VYFLKNVKTAYFIPPADDGALPLHALIHLPLKKQAYAI